MNEEDQQDAPQLDEDLLAIVEAQTEDPALPQKFKLGDEEYDEKQLAELVTAGKNATAMQQGATQKWQEAADMRRAAEELQTGLAPLKEFRDVWEQGPEARENLIKDLANRAGISIQMAKKAATEAYNDSDDIKPEALEDYDPVVKAMYRKNQRLEAQMQAERAERAEKDKEVLSTLKAVQGQLDKTNAEKEMASKAKQAQATLQADLSVKVTVDALLDAVSKTGIPDPEAAWLKLNKTAVKGAVSQSQVEKPDVPGTRGKTFDPMDPRLNADDLARLAGAGYTPVVKRI